MPLGQTPYANAGTILNIPGPSAIQRVHLEDGVSSVRSYSSSMDDYSDSERDGPPHKLLKSSASPRIRDGRELIQV